MNTDGIFADAFNFYLYDGKPVICPEQLHELDTAELALPYGTDGAASPVQRFRDSLKELSAMEDGRAAYLLLGIEGQTSVHYAAPVRNLLYDALQYAKQVEQAAKSRRMTGSHKNHGRGEFLSGFYRDDRLIPVITLVLFFSPDAWDAPRSLHEMMAVQDPVILSMVPDYQIHMVVPAEIRTEDFGKFRTSLGDVLTFIKYSKDKQKMQEWFRDAKEGRMFGKKEVDVLNACVNAKIRMESNEEEMDMCEAFRQMIEEATEQATAKATKQTTERVQLNSIKNLMHNLHMTAEQAIAALGISEAEGEKLMRRL